MPMGVVIEDGFLNLVFGWRPTEATFAFTAHADECHFTDPCS